MRYDDPQIESVEVDPPAVLPGEPFTVAVATSEGGQDDEIDGVLSGPDGRRVRLRFEHARESEFQDLWLARATVEDPGRWEVLVEGAQAVEFEVAEREGTAESRIRDFALQPDPADPGDTLTFTGRLERAVRGDWASLPAGQLVVVAFRAEDEFAWYPITEAKTGDGGRFTTTATAVESGFWRAEFRGAGDQRATRSAEVASTVTRSAGDVKLSHGLAPASVRKGKTVTHRGTVRYWTGSRWSKVANRTVILRVSGTDYPGMSDTTDSQGKYRITEHAQKSGARTAVFRRQGDYSAGTSPSHEVTVT